MRASLITSFVLAGVVFPWAANAQESAALNGEWTIRKFENATRHTVDDTVYEIATNTGDIAAAFRCQDGALTVYISLDAAEIETAPEKAGRARDVKTEYRLGDHSGREIWGYLSHVNVIYPLKESTARMMYNAVLRGEPIIIETKRFERTEIALPTIDKATASQFKNSCWREK